MKRIIGTGLAVAMSLAGQLLAATPAAAAPQIRLLNPSPLSAGQVPELSTSEGPLHFVAWVKEVPASPQAEFELQLIGGPLPGQTQTIDAIRVGNGDIWEAFFTPPSSVPEGQYLVTARLFSEGQEVTSSSQVATLERADIAPAVDSVEIDHPSNGQSFGFYGRTDGLQAAIRVSPSVSTDQVQVFYSTSDPGAAPEWIACGRQTVQQPQVTVLCRLSGVAIQSISAIAAVANNTPPPGEPQRLADDGMDAHRINPYEQTAAQLSISPASVRAEVAACRVFTTTLLDQFSYAVAGAPVDVHAEGPTDQLRFVTADSSPLMNDTDPFQAPNESHLSRESAMRCSDRSVFGQQGDHNLPGQADRKHIESITGTDANGRFRFGLISDTAGSTAITAWADVQEDDFQSATEAAAVAVLGWGQDPPAPSRYVFLDPDLISASTETCRRIVAVARDGGDPMAGVSIDLHLKGPDTARFCSPSGGSARQPPDSGGHSGTLHTDGTRHVEGKSDADGRFIFGVISRSSGDSAVTAWLDLFDDDAQVSGEPSAVGRISWVRDGERSISIRAAKKNVRSGDSVEISGEIIGDPACESHQPVVLKARDEGGASFTKVSRTSTNPRGFYSFVVEATTTREYKTVAPRSRSPKCLKAGSHILTIRVR